MRIAVARIDCVINTILITVVATQRQTAFSVIKSRVTVTVGVLEVAIAGSIGLSRRDKRTAEDRGAGVVGVVQVNHAITVGIIVRDIAIVDVGAGEAGSWECLDRIRNAIAIRIQIKVIIDIIGVCIGQAQAARQRRIGAGVIIVEHIHQAITVTIGNTAIGSCCFNQGQAAAVITVCYSIPQAGLEKIADAIVVTVEVA